MSPPRSRRKFLLLAAVALGVLVLALRFRGGPPASGFFEDSSPGSTPVDAPTLEGARGAPRAPQSPQLPGATKAPPPSMDAPVSAFARAVKLGQSLLLAEALAKNGAFADAYVDRLCDEHRRLAEKPPLEESDKSGTDAAEYLAPLIDYEPPLDDPPGRLHIAQPLLGRLEGMGADSMLKITPKDLEGLDFGWLKDLQAFDHWTLLTAGRLKDHPPGDFGRDPIPNYVSLSWWVKLRFALAFKRGDLAHAASEVRHLAELINTQGLLISTASAASMRLVEGRARELAAASGLDVSGWPAPDSAALRTYRSTAFASVYFTYPGVSDETLRKAARCMSAPCAALLEGLGANATFSAYGSHSNRETLEELFRQARCETPLLARASVARELPVGVGLDEMASAMAEQIPKALLH